MEVVYNSSGAITSLNLTGIPSEEDLESLEKHPYIFPSGTPFQEEVWRALLEIPWGETRTYSEIAQRIGKPKAYRAVANACGRNPVAYLIPCHRVIGKTNLGGYSCHGGIEVKKYLLARES